MFAFTFTFLKITSFRDPCSERKFSLSRILFVIMRHEFASTLFSVGSLKKCRAGTLIKRKREWHFTAIETINILFFDFHYQSFFFSYFVLRVSYKKLGSGHSHSFFIFIFNHLRRVTLQQRLFFKGPSI